ncbi:MAG TPA: hypothetical protein VN456_10390 [Desulfosporosinus sp.]|nr:hypothetical protein [Desulfosporosinus sp.]
MLEQNRENWPVLPQLWDYRQKSVYWCEDSPNPIGHVKRMVEAVE